MKKAILMSLLSFIVTLTSFGQITTSTLAGVVKNEKGEVLAGIEILDAKEIIGNGQIPPVILENLNYLVA